MFDYSDVLNTVADKKYPYVFWDIVNSVTNVSLRDEFKEMQINVYAVAIIDEQDNSFDVYDDLEYRLKGYLLNVNTVSRISLISTKSELEYYPRGSISIDSEIGIRIRIEIQVLC